MFHIILLQKKVSWYKSRVAISKPADAVNTGLTILAQFCLSVYHMLFSIHECATSTNNLLTKHIKHFHFWERVHFYTGNEFSFLIITELFKILSSYELYKELTCRLFHNDRTNALSEMDGNSALGLACTVWMVSRKRLRRHFTTQHVLVRGRSHCFTSGFFPACKKVWTGIQP